MRDNRPYQVYEDTAYEGETAMINQCLRQIKQDIEPVETNGPAGTVVLVSAATVGLGRDCCRDSDATVAANSGTRRRCISPAPTTART